MTTSTLTIPRVPRAAVAVAAVWLGLAIIAGATGFLARLPFPGPQLIIFALFVALLIVVTGLPALRAWVDALPFRVLVGINTVRFIGIAFLVLAAQGRLDPVFAARAGWGDIAVAVLALVLISAGELHSRLHRGLIYAWNAFGLLDLVVAVATATSVTLRGAAPGIAPLLSFPLVVVPMVLVPIFLANHFIIFRRLLAAGRAGRDR